MAAQLVGSYDGQQVLEPRGNGRMAGRRRTAEQAKLGALIPAGRMEPSAGICAPCQSPIVNQRLDDPSR